MIEVFCGNHTDEMGKASLKWYEDGCGQGPVEMFFTYITWVKDGEIAATALYEGYKKGSIEMHFLIKMPLTRAILRDMFYYPFDQLGVNTVFIRFPRRNEKNLTTVQRLGFKYLATIPECYGNGRKNDGLLFTLNKEKSLKWRQYECLSTAAPAIS